MVQKIIQVGNSYAVVIPKNLVDELNWKVGEKVFVDKDALSDSIRVQTKPSEKESAITPEFYSWLKEFNKKYKTALIELAKK